MRIKSKFEKDFFFLLSCVRKRLTNTNKLSIASFSLGFVVVSIKILKHGGGGPVRKFPR